MKAVVWHRVGGIRMDDVPEPQIREPADAVIRLTSSAICGTDLHFVRGSFAAGGTSPFPGWYMVRRTIPQSHELGYQPGAIGRRLSPHDLGFHPSSLSLRHDPRDPLDP
ncbi:hypothetical protein [Stakelama pacifica]|uniref:hypothetical protein n=1 Tax=Stakelama pacifica TaxID=517720 RepID=UPI0019C98E69|nr:hypothetical protein [Stakelama pacifica]GGO93405.1 hypothetical protein GCM10011329_12750 [Stakelama pacifica]